MTGTPLRGHALALAALEAIREDPGGFDPTSWRCGSTMCFGGWAATLAGGRWLVTPDEDGDLRLLPNGEYASGASFYAQHLLLADSEIDPERYITSEYGYRVIHVGERAAITLGLDPDLDHVYEASRLFHPDNTFWTLARLIEAAYTERAEA
ncbi:hypothetical protein [Bailinhaonella thermotolerans]|uniref:Uncharacterized protein n=1 Tax=Bailinhaonella thermotolerans TaxID=1070861 RepID=A0A3A4A1B3_9ACTN|nr:hypothetical protein [Bailinhaonella thermotolerans]RJL21042.1 hypothetical protein D5H75_38155 [Bailinhaonella thermotolerans]